MPVRARGGAGGGGRPVLVGIDAEFGLIGSTSAQAIQRGAEVAMAEINAAGGVLGGRPLGLVTRDNRSVPARGIENLKELAAMEDMVAALGGRFSPVLLEQLDLARDLGLILLAPWSSADGITDNGQSPNWVFHLSLKDSHAMPLMLDHARARGFRRVGLLLANTAWGRSNLAAAERAAAERAAAERDAPRLVGSAWYNWGGNSLVEPYLRLRRAGADAVVFVANDREASILLREMAGLPEAERLPLIAHWGVTGGRLVEAAGPDLFQVDMTVVQTFAFSRADPTKAKQVLETARRLHGTEGPDQVLSPVGFAHAYDLVHLLARAVEAAGTTDRAAVRGALERLGPYDGLTARLERPFTPTRHDALPADAPFMAR